MNQEELQIPRKSYHTKQKDAVLALMRTYAQSFISIDELLGQAERTNLCLSRTTLYRALERMVEEGVCEKLAALGKEAARYRYKTSEDHATGTLLCSTCGHAELLDCSMLEDLQNHVSKHHGFQVAGKSSVIYGICKRCQ